MLKLFDEECLIFLMPSPAAPHKGLIPDQYFAVSTKASKQLKLNALQKRVRSSQKFCMKYDDIGVPPVLEMTQLITSSKSSKQIFRTINYESWQTRMNQKVPRLSILMKQWLSAQSTFFSNFWTPLMVVSATFIPEPMGVKVSLKHSGSYGTGRFMDR